MTINNYEFMTQSQQLKIRMLEEDWEDGVITQEQYRDFISDIEDEMDELI